MSQSNKPTSGTPKKTTTGKKTSTGTPSGKKTSPGTSAAKKGSSNTGGKSRTTKKNAPKKALKNKNSGVKLLLLGMCLVGIILISAIVVLDHQAMKKGQVGFWETVTGVIPARTAVDVENLSESILSSYGITPENLLKKGSTTSTHREGEKLRHVVYKIPSSELLRTLLSEFEDRARKSGVKVHNRHVVKEPQKWIATFYLGTYTTRTHKLELVAFPSGTPTPMPIPDRYLNQPESTSEPTSTPKTVSPIEPTQSFQKQLAENPEIQAKIALIFDDFGYDISMAQRFLTELDVPITLAIIPYQDYSRQIIDLTLKANQTPFLHLPLEPSNPSAMGTQAEMFLTTAMSDETLRLKTRQALEISKGVVGVNNHTGSKLTTDPHRMKIILSEIKRHNLIFVDSRTIPSTIAEEIAHELGIKAASRKVFLDQGYAGGDVGKNLQRLVIEAKKSGSAIGIGHAIGSTLDDLKENLAFLHEEGIQIVPIADLVH